MSTRITYIYQGRMSTREAYVLLLIRESIATIHLSRTFLFMCILQSVHLKGVCISWARLFRGHASQRPASHRLTSYPLHGQHLVQPRRSLDGSAPYSGA